MRWVNDNAERWRYRDVEYGCSDRDHRVVIWNSYGCILGPCDNNVYLYGGNIVGLLCNKDSDDQSVAIIDHRPFGGMCGSNDDAERWRRRDMGEQCYVSSHNRQQQRSGEWYRYGDNADPLYITYGLYDVDDGNGEQCTDGNCGPRHSVRGSDYVAYRPCRRRLMEQQYDEFGDSRVTERYCNGCNRRHIHDDHVFVGDRLYGYQNDDGTGVTSGDQRYTHGMRWLDDEPWRCDIGRRMEQWRYRDSDGEQYRYSYGRGSGHGNDLVYGIRLSCTGIGDSQYGAISDHGPDDSMCWRYDHGR